MVTMPKLGDIDLRLLRVFTTIVEAGGLTGAQVTLNLGQSTISTQLAELEKRLGLRLCRRGRAGFALTAAGEKLYAASGDLFAAVDRFQMVSASVSGEMKGTLRLGTVDGMISNPDFDLPAILGAFAERAPSVVLELSIDPPDGMERSIAEGQRDIAIGPFVKRGRGTATGITYVPLYRERQAIFCGAGHPLFGRRKVSLEQIRKAPFVARRYLHRFDLEIVGHLQASAIVDQMEAQAALVLSNRFIGFLPIHYAAQLVRERRLQKLSCEVETEYDSPFFLLHKKGAEDNVVLRNFLNRIQDGLRTNNLS
ncbi:LysR family transcriptional regulator [Dongia mobilis]|jgi:DNA-binding transcriptional LysR family regulator|uniref:LysR family transcriptional regulator n=1 Tax=Dongia sp. TaxID=1977262 RepID=UPI0026ECF038